MKDDQLQGSWEQGPFGKLASAQGWMGSDGMIYGTPLRHGLLSPVRPTEFYRLSAVGLAPRWSPVTPT
jgi:hypothetical protein